MRSSANPPCRDRWRSVIFNPGEFAADFIDYLLRQFKIVFVDFNQLEEMEAPLREFLPVAPVL